MPTDATSPAPPADLAPRLPADDPEIFTLDLRGLRSDWAARAALTAISAEMMTGADHKAQALGYPQERLMEHAGTAVAAAVRALAMDLDRWGTGPIVILCGPGNNGGDGYVVARRLALAGARVIVGVVASESRPQGAAAARNWDRIARDTGIDKVHLPVARDVAMFGKGIEKAAVVVDALLGTGVRGALREPIRSAVGVIERARAAGDPGRRRRHADGRRSVERRAVGAGGAGGPDRHVPSTEDGPAHQARRRLRRQGARRADRDPGGCRPWLTAAAERRQPGWREVLLRRGRGRRGRPRRGVRHEPAPDRAPGGRLPDTPSRSGS